MIEKWKDSGLLDGIDKLTEQDNPVIKLMEPSKNQKIKEPPYVSDDFQIGPDGAFEYEDDDISDWDDTLMDGLEDE